MTQLQTFKEFRQSSIDESKIVEEIYQELEEGKFLDSMKTKFKSLIKVVKDHFEKHGDLYVKLGQAAVYLLVMMFIQKRMSQGGPLDRYKSSAIEKVKDQMAKKAAEQGNMSAAQIKKIMNDPKLQSKLSSAYDKVKSTLPDMEVPTQVGDYKLA